MFIKKSCTEKIETIARIEDVIGNYVNLQKKGANYMGLSPFVDEKSPSFSVSPSKEVWKCFSSGKGGVGYISFLMEYKSLSYPEALKEIANKYTVEIEYEDSAQAKQYQKRQERKTALLPLMQSVVKKFEDAFWALPEDHPAKKEVFENRQYPPEVAKLYRIGYAPGQRFIYDLCVEHGCKEDAKEIGLISDKGDKWVNRLIYPLTEVTQGKSQVVGVAGRRLNDDAKYAKWMNPINSKLYQKDNFWYGLDIAKKSIVKQGKAWLVEGYNDVIAWQQFGIPNTIAPCGTSIATNQIRLLKKYCDHVVFCMDPDQAGIKSMLKHIKLFLKQGFRTHVVQLENNLDPDDYVRHIKAKDEEALDSLKDRKNWVDGFRFLLEHNKSEDEVEQFQKAQEFVVLIHQIEDVAMQEIYLQWLAKETNQKITTIRKIFKEVTIEEIEPNLNTSQDFNTYELPDEVKEPLEQLLPTIKRYQLFQANNMIYAQMGDTPPYTFRSISNFYIEIIQHMNDENNAKKLVRLVNIHKKESVFDMPSEAMNTPNAFENEITKYGNYQWKGKREQHQLLKFYLFDSMGTGRQVEVLGWQPEGFWCWNNLVITEEGEEMQISENGTFNYKGVSYYVPSANSIYANNHFKFQAQKRFISINTKNTFFEIAKRTQEVHRNHGLIGILFAVASIFQDVVVRELNSFPLLFLYGPASSGKDQLAEIIQGFMGVPQVAINLEGNSSTMKAKIIEFAQFCNGISQLSEYKPGNPDLDGTIKGLWDRRGYKRSGINSFIQSDSIPILSSAVITANFMPDQEAVITRKIWNLMDKTIFNSEEEQRFSELLDITKRGYSCITNQFLKHRKLVDFNFKDQYRSFKSFLKEQKPETNSRMLQNLSVLGAMYKILSNEIDFPFNLGDIVKVFEKTIDLQMNKLNSANVIYKFMDCFLASLRGNHTDILQVGRDLKLDGFKLYFQWTNTYNKVSRQWSQQYKGDPIPSKSVMSDAIQKDPMWVDYVDSFYYSSAKRSSAFCVNIEDLEIAEELILNIQYQEDKQNGQYNAFDNSNYDPPVTPDEENNKNDSGKLPF